MPPLKGIDWYLTGDILKALADTGHGDAIFIVDPSFPIPEGSRVYEYGGTTTEALSGVLRLVAVEGQPRDKSWLYVMNPDTRVWGDVIKEANSIADTYQINSRPIFRMDDVDGGFYARSRMMGHRRIFIRTRDHRPYACAYFIVGHMQAEE